jgi:hypothetical protein
MQLLATQLRNTSILITLASAPKDVQAFPITLAPSYRPTLPPVRASVRRTEVW